MSRLFRSNPCRTRRCRRMAAPNCFNPSQGTRLHVLHLPVSKTKAKDNSCCGVCAQTHRKPQVHLCPKISRICDNLGIHGALSNQREMIRWTSENVAQQMLLEHLRPCTRALMVDSIRDCISVFAHNSVPRPQLTWKLNHAVLHQKCSSPFVTALIDEGSCKSRLHC